VTESEYGRKRSFEATPEPPTEVVEGDVDPFTAPPGERFVIQQHYATRLHHDVRLEMLNGDTPVLVSWAVPKRLPRHRGERHLAIHTEDHPMGYADFAGSIPEGNYGAGEVRIFDRGSYEMVERTEDRITFRLQGERLDGTFHLILTGTEDGKERWLALRRDEGDTTASPRPPEPMLATLAAEPFDDPRWGFEPKWDGVRTIAVCDAGTRLVSRNGKDVTAGYPELASIHDRLVALDAVVDGEIVAMDEGRPSFQLLQQRMHVRDESKVERLAKRIPATFIAFDLLRLDGQDLADRALSERRALLEEVVVPDERTQVSPLVPGDGLALYQAAVAQGLEGIVAKQLDSRYEAGKRSRTWLKVKVTFDADVVVVGWTEGEGRRAGGLGSLVMAVYDAEELRYVGNVGTGFDAAALDDAWNRLTALDQTDPPFGRAVVGSRPELRRAHWVEPLLVAQVEHRQLTDAGRLRAPSFKGFREDKAPRECTFDQLVEPGVRPPV
jgi:bifunctional non-homologous end joining protein LigD